MVKLARGGMGDAGDVVDVGQQNARVSLEVACRRAGVVTPALTVLRTWTVRDLRTAERAVDTTVRAAWKGYVDGMSVQQCIDFAATVEVRDVADLIPWTISKTPLRHVGLPDEVIRPSGYVPSRAACLAASESRSALVRVRREVGWTYMCEAAHRRAGFTARQMLEAVKDAGFWTATRMVIYEDIRELCLQHNKVIARRVLQRTEVMMWMLDDGATSPPGASIRTYV